MCLDSASAFLASIWRFDSFLAFEPCGAPGMAGNGLFWRALRVRFTLLVHPRQELLKSYGYQPTSLNIGASQPRPRNRTQTSSRRNKRGAASKASTRSRLLGRPWLCHGLSWRALSASIRRRRKSSRSFQHWLQKGCLFALYACGDSTVTPQAMQVS